MKTVIRKTSSIKDAVFKEALPIALREKGNWSKYVTDLIRRDMDRRRSTKSRKGTRRVVAA